MIRDGMELGLRPLGVALLSTVLICAAPGHDALADPCPSPDAIHVGSIDKPFSQERYLSGVAQPLKSSGRIKIDSGEIHWHMLVPFDVNTIITAQGISQSINGAPPQPTGMVDGFGPQLAR